jgi:hypothetical protein
LAVKDGKCDFSTLVSGLYRQPEAQSKDFVTKAAKDRPAVEVSSLKGNQNSAQAAVAAFWRALV